MAKAMSITSRYQVTVPKEVRDTLGINREDSLVFSIKQGQVTVEKAPQLQDIQKQAQKLMKKRGLGHISDEEMGRAREIFQREGLKW